jgi:hypothetical protein
LVFNGRSQLSLLPPGDDAQRFRHIPCEKGPARNQRRRGMLRLLAARKIRLQQSK